MINISHVRLAQCLALFSAALLFGCKTDSSTDAAAQSEMPVLVMTVNDSNIGHTLTRSMPAVLVPRYAFDMSFQVAGRISQRHVEVGQTVKKGQELLRLDDKDYLLALAAAEADAKQASADELRFKTLLEQGVISTSDFERHTVRSEAARSQYQMAKNRVQYSVLTAPYDGVVTRITAEAGQVVNEGLPVLTLARTDVIEVEVDLPENLVANAERYKATVQLQADTTKPFTLKLRELAPAASQPLRTYSARFSFADADHPTLKNLRLGMTAQLRLSAEDADLSINEGVVSLPASALMSSVDKPFVWLLAEGANRVQRHSVQVVAFQNDTVSVLGLPQGSQVVIAGVQKLDEAMLVRGVQRTGAGIDAVSGERQ